MHKSSKFGNSKFFLSLRFYAKSILALLIVIRKKIFKIRVSEDKVGVAEKFLDFYAVWASC